MESEIQWFLVEELSQARAHLGLRNDFEAKQRQLTHFGGVLAAFRYSGSITQDEQNTWNRKMLAALGYELSDPAPAGVAQAIYVGDPAKRQSQPKVQSAAVFIRSQPGPDREFEVHGGKLRVISLEFYDSMVSVRWRVSPPPDITSAFPAETSAIEEDIVGLEDWAAEELRRKGHQKLSMMRLYHFGLSDDLGTNYVPLGLRHGSSSIGTAGEVEFQAPPKEASELSFSWLDLDVRIPLV